MHLGWMIKQSIQISMVWTYSLEHVVVCFDLLFNFILSFHQKSYVPFSYTWLNSVVYLCHFHDNFGQIKGIYQINLRVLNYYRFYTYFISENRTNCSLQSKGFNRNALNYSQSLFFWVFTAALKRTEKVCNAIYVLESESMKFFLFISGWQNSFWCIQFFILIVMDSLFLLF